VTSRDINPEMKPRAGDGEFYRERASSSDSEAADPASDQRFLSTAICNRRSSNYASDIGSVAPDFSPLDFIGPVISRG